MTAVPPVVELAEAHRYDAAVLGGKAAALARQAAAGLPVPPGFVVTTAGAVGAWEEAVAVALARLGGERFAVRSSAVAEDLADASYAGLYETVLDVTREEVPEAVRRCLRSATGSTVAAYRAASPPAAGETSAAVGEPSTAAGAPAGPMAVLVQRMVRPRAAGVAFTADPRTGERDTTVVTAVRGLGDRLVAGEAVGDEWTVTGGVARCVRDTESALDEREALAVAALAARAAEVAGAPQDVEWALDGTGVVLLQARPMTALPEPVTFHPPGPGSWMRNFRFGEWLPEPLTPLFADLLLPRLEEGFQEAMTAEAGAAVRFPYGLVHGWYYAAHPRPPAVLAALARGRLRLVRYLRTMLVEAGRRPERAHRTLLNDLASRWRADALPRYRRTVAHAEARVDAAPATELVALAEELARLAGEQMFWISAVGGAAWKMEGALATFLRQWPACREAVQWLLCALPGAEPRPQPHAVLTLDWVRPTAGETGALVGAVDQRRRRDLAARRERAEASCRAALRDRPDDLTRFDTLLGLARRYAVLREEQARALTLGWPVLRRIARRLGDLCVAAGVVDAADDVFFLTRDELVAGPRPRPRSSLRRCVRERRAEWERQRRLTPPLRLGPPEKLAEKFLHTTVEAVRAPAAVTAETIVGHPASPGRAVGPARLVRGPEDFARFAEGDVLLAHATAPAWTPLFLRAAAVVTDGGTLAAHASLIAREYGIPAVVGTGDATARIKDRQVVVVDGNAGTVEVVG